MTTPNPRFVRAIVNSIHYWQQRLEQLNDDQIRQLNPQHPNLLRAAEFGVVLPVTQAITADLALKSFPLVERCGHWQAWLSLMGQLIAVMAEEPGVQLRLMNRQGQLLRFHQQVDEALYIHEDVVQMAEKLDDRQVLAEAHFHLSVDLRLKRFYAQAETSASTALALFSKLPQAQTWKAATLNSMGLIAQEQGDLAGAAEKLSQAVALWQQTDQRTELARVLNNLAITLQAQGDFEAALQNYQAAQKWLAPTASELDKLKVQNSLGSLYFEWGRYQEAEVAFKAVNTPVLRQSGNFYTRAALWQNLGNVLLKQNRLAEAKVYLQRSQMLWQQIHNRVMLANTTGTLAEVLSAQDECQLAMAYYNKALVLLKDERHHPLAQKLYEEFLTKKQLLERCGRKKPDNPQ